MRARDCRRDGSNRRQVVIGAEPRDSTPVPLYLPGGLNVCV
jgi:hypothetical protein